jgi:acyl-CoA thioester hydrolase
MTEPFAFETTVALRAQDFDPMGHVNHVAYGAYREQARERYFRSVLDKGLADELNTVTVSSSIDHHQPITAEHEHVTVGISPGELGETSIPLDYEIGAGGTVVASGEMTQVVYSRSEKEPVPIPAEWRERLQQAREEAATASTREQSDQRGCGDD